MNLHTLVYISTLSYLPTRKNKQTDQFSFPAEISNPSGLLQKICRPVRATSISQDQFNFFHNTHNKHLTLTIGFARTSTTRRGTTRTYQLVLSSPLTLWCSATEKPKQDSGFPRFITGRSTSRLKASSRPKTRMKHRENRARTATTVLKHLGDILARVLRHFSGVQDQGKRRRRLLVIVARGTGTDDRLAGGSRSE